MRYTDDLAGLMRVLDDLAKAAREDDRETYLAVLAHAERLRVAEEQIKDARWWGSQTRMRSGLGTATSFDWKGEVQ